MEGTYPRRVTPREVGRSTSTRVKHCKRRASYAVSSCGEFCRVSRALAMRAKAGVSGNHDANRRQIAKSLIT